MYTNITENCKNVIARSSRTFAASFVIDGTKYSDIKKATISVPSTANGMITIGGAVSNNVEIITEKVNVLHGQKIEVFESVKLDSGEYEDIPMGCFRITSAKTKDSLTTIIAGGPLSTEAVFGYFSELEYPATTIQILDEISQFIGVPIEVDNLEEIYVESKPEGYICREVIGFIAAIHGKNAVETRNGTIALKWYEDSEEDIFTDKTDSPELSNSIFTVNKFECATGSNTWSKGNGTEGIVISNPLMTDAMADYVWEKIFGFSYRPGTFNIKSGTPCVDPWDSFLYNNERVIATELQYVYDGGLQNVYKSSGKTESSNVSKGPMAIALERYYAELLIVKNIAVKSMTVDEADIRYARVDQMDVIEANITSAVIDSIDGRYASIDYIQANYVSTQVFDALEGRVDKLETDSLTAESAIIKDLEADITRTNTLIFGSASGTSIQTEFSNSVIAVLGDAQIKSAMIESVSAAKITAGDIITNNVRVMSEDGSLVISDETMQISDANRVRVQIGKDALDDYNMYVWDSSGNLMFDALGLTEYGITRQVIRDEIVKDDANINAAKLDINSLFEEINDSSNTIKSTKVYFDSEGQTLDVVFQSMTDTVTTVTSTANSALSSANEANSKIDGLEVGGRNYLKNSGDEVTITSTYGYQWYTLTAAKDNLLNKTITVSWDARKDDDSATANMYAYLRTSSGSLTPTSAQIGDCTTEWARYSVTFEAGTNPTSAVYCGIHMSNGELSNKAHLRNVKLEIGNKATDWTPAPEDTEAEIESIITTVSAQGTQISTIQGQITSKIWQEDITTAINNIEIGGRNLILGSEEISTTRNAANKDWVSEKIPFMYNSDYGFALIQEGGEFTLSFDYEITGVTTACTVIFCLRYTNVSYSNIGMSLPLAVGDNVGHFEHTFTPTSEQKTYGNAWLLAGFGAGNNASVGITFRNIKLEKGNKATDWTAAPEDLEADITTLNTQYSEIDQKLTSITATVASHTTEIENKADGSTVTTLQTQVATLETSLSGFQSTVSSTYATKTEVDAIEVGGRNLLLKSDVLKNNTSYGIAHYYFGDEVPVEGETYTVTIKGALGSDRTYFRAYNSGGMISFGTLVDKGNGIYSYTGTWKVSTSSNTYLQIYQFTQSGTTASTIEWIKLEKGNKATDWTPAPEDIETRVTSAESNITQLSKEISLKVDEDGVIAAINLSSETALIQASRINLVGAVTFNSLDSNTQSLINTANNVANTALEAANTATPFIIGTQTAATGSWTGVAPFASLVDGQQITYWLPYKGSGNATLNLTLPDGTTTGAIPCYYSGSARITTHYAAGNTIHLTYHVNANVAGSTYTGWWADATYNSDTYDRIRYSGIVKASSAITSANIIVGNASGYHNLKTGGSFDIGYPILYAGSSIASGSTGNNNYLAIAFAVASTQSITLTAYKAVYIKGTLNGSTFTPVSTAPLTQTVPTSDDGYYYILLGTGYSTTAIYLSTEHPIYCYKNGAFKSTAQISSEIAAWCYNNNATYIDGGKIYTNSIKAESIDVENLFAQDITASGTITGLDIISTDGTANGTVSLIKGLLTVGNTAGSNVSIANAGVNLNYVSTRVGGIDNASAYGMRLYAKERMFLQVGDDNVITVNESDSYAGMIHVSYPMIFDDDIYPVNIDCANITCTDVRVRNGVSLAELSSKNSLISVKLADGFYGYVYNNVFFIRLDGANCGNLASYVIPDPYKPNSTYWQAVIIQNLTSGGFYMGILKVTTDGYIKCYAPASMGATSLVDCSSNTFKVYGTIDYYYS